jgi:AraC family transcriptional regulator of arabinose operon
MKIQSGFYNNTNEDIVNTEYDIAINSCGRYELIKQKDFRTIRPGGRKDFQLLYVAKGKGIFMLRGETQTVSEGSIVIYLPSEDQYYEYYLEDSPIVYWLHFSGYDAYNFLKENNLLGHSSFYVGVNSAIPLIFDKIIRELQLTQARHFEICNLLIKELITICSRYLIEASSNIYKRNNLLDAAIDYFNENSHADISIENYAKRCNMSCCWFIRTFRNYTGTTPAQYITNIRINKAKNLLNTGSFTITEVSNLVGYDNPLYFSRIFKKNVGVAPKGYYINKATQET